MRKYWLIIILIAAAALRLYGLDRGDTVNDEVFYAFRAIGMLDFDKAEVQTTPLEWMDPNIPWWTKLSFHDHPPLVFWVQNIFMKVFGDKRWAFRLPSALLGVASVYLIYLIGRKLFSQNASLAESRRAGLLAAAFFAVTLNNVYITRTGMQESFVIFFMLLASYLFLKNYFVWTGAIMGLAFLTKYNTFILAPIFLVYLLIYRRRVFLNKKFWLGALLPILIFSPVIIYNIKLYQVVGHFDFQLSYVFGQEHPEWQIQPGKEVGGLGDRLKNFIPRLIATNSWLFLILFAISLIFLRNTFLFLMFGFLFLLLLLIGPSYRFLTMLTPWMALSIGLFFQVGECSLSAGLMPRVCGNNPSPRPPPLGGGGKKREFLSLLGVGLLIFVLAFEIFYSYNNQITYYPKGPTPWLTSKVRYENYNWGYNELNDYLENELSGKMPALTFYPKYQFLNKLQDEVLADDRAKNLEPYPALLVYYGNVDDGPRLWTFDRLRFYHAWPIIAFDTYRQFLKENGLDYYKKTGFKNYYFIMQTNIVPSAEFQREILGIEPELIKNKRDDIVFKVYKFVL